jgi:hypothetical protein
MGLGGIVLPEINQSFPEAIVPFFIGVPDFKSTN